jgi:hypothetical protein
MRKLRVILVTDGPLKRAFNIIIHGVLTFLELEFFNDLLANFFPRQKWLAEVPVDRGC